MQQCEVCSAKVNELRRGRCWGCYTRWVESRPVGLGAACCMCSERRRDFLKSVELLGNWMPVCYSCSARAARLVPMPQTVAGIRSALSRDRRNTDRRSDTAHDRAFRHDRRTGDRRLPRDGGDDMTVDDEMIVAIMDLAARLDSVDEDLTRIVERPTL